LRPRMTTLSLKVSPKDIYYISWNIDACEGLGMLRTDDAIAGNVTVHAPFELLSDILDLIDGLKAEGLDIIISGIA
jgi:hypothetical protein